MGNALNQDARAIWLMLVNDGNWWSAKGLTHYWRPTFALHEMQEFLNALHGGGFITHRDSLAGVQYAFTSECKQLPGTDLQPTPSINTGAIV